MPDYCASTSRAVLACIAGAVLAAGCASTNPKDPLEGFNRGVFAFNEAADKVAIKPLAQGYDTVVPLPGKVVISNFFANLVDPWIALNNLLQGKPKEALTDVARFLVNTSAGILGSFDVATEMGLVKHDEDSGQTLGRWGVGEGAYVVLPIIGPRTVRDTVGLVIDGYADPVWYVSDVAARNSLVGVRFVNARAQLLPLDKTIREAALDKYAYMRNAYLQRRRNLVFDGNPPREKDEDSRSDTEVPMAGGLDSAVDAGQVTVAPRSEATAPDAAASEEGNESAPSRVDVSGTDAVAVDAVAAGGNPPQEKDDGAGLQTDVPVASGPDPAIDADQVSVAPRSEPAVPEGVASEQINESTPSRVDASRTDAVAADTASAEDAVAAGESDDAVR